MSFDAESDQDESTDTHYVGQIAPKEVKRRIWLSNPNKFRRDIVPIVKAYSSDPDIIRLAKEMSIEHPAKVITQR